ncbi:MAG: hypothetical protein J2P47_02160 [Acetobacteraceae bacterium]|nr:hypothetical protein [Acetobacteraceae bacterium]
MDRGVIGERAALSRSLRAIAYLTVAAACWVAGGEQASGQTEPEAPAPPATAAYPGATIGPLIPLGGPVGARNQVSGFGPPEPPEAGWTFVPRVDVSEAFNDNIFETSSNHTSDFITFVTPSIRATGDLPRLQARLFYAPTGVIYASNGDQDMLAQNLNATATATLVPDTLFVYLRGFSAVEPTFGGIPQIGGGFALVPGNGISSGISPFLTRNNATQSSTFSIAPYVTHHIGTFGSLSAGVSYSYTNSQLLSDSGLTFPVTASGANGSLNTYNEVIQFTSGEDWGRIRDLALATGTQFEGTGVTQGAYEYIASNQIGYAIARRLTVFGELGAETIHFASIPATNTTDAVWAFGLQWTPNPESSITIGYGHKYGQSGLVFNGFYQPTPRTQIFAQYQTGLGTDLTQLQNFGLNSGIDLLGNSVDQSTGAPLFLTSSILGSTGNANLYRTKTLTGGVIANLDRDQLSLQLVWQDRQFLAGTNRLTATSSTAFSGILGWIHQLNPDTQSIAYVSYGRQTGLLFGGFGQESEDTYAAQLALRYNFTATLSGIAQYTYTERLGNVPGLSFSQNVVLLGLSKQF